MQASAIDSAQPGFSAASDELIVALAPYPFCKDLIQQFRAALKAPTKTPIALLHEYATRLNLQVCDRQLSRIFERVLQVGFSSILRKKIFLYVKSSRRAF
jgi:hypothetical protein